MSEYGSSAEGKLQCEPSATTSRSARASSSSPTTTTSRATGKHPHVYHQPLPHHPDLRPHVRYDSTSPSSRTPTAQIHAQGDTLLRLLQVQHLITPTSPLPMPSPLPTEATHQAIAPATDSGHICRMCGFRLTPSRLWPIAIAAPSPTKTLPPGSCRSIAVTSRMAASPLHDIEGILEMAGEAHSPAIGAAAPATDRPQPSTA